MATTEDELPTQEETKVEEPAPSEVAPSQAEETTELEEEPAETPEEPAEPPISRRKAERLEKLESLVSRLKGEEAKPDPPKVGGMDYRTALDADDAVIDQLEADRKSGQQESFNQGLEQAKSIQFHTRLEIDAPKIEGKYPIFNKESEDFNPAASNAINSWYLASVGYNQETGKVANANVRYYDFVEGIMELANEMAGVKVEKTQTNIAKQAASTGLRPDGSSAKRMNLNKLPQQMTDEELKAVIAQAGL